MYWQPSKFEANEWSSLTSFSDECFGHPDDDDDDEDKDCNRWRCDWMHFIIDMLTFARSVASLNLLLPNGEAWYNLIEWSHQLHTSQHDSEIQRFLLVNLLKRNTAERIYSLCIQIRIQRLRRTLVSMDENMAFVFLIYKKKLCLSAENPLLFSWRDCAFFVVYSRIEAFLFLHSVLFTSIATALFNCVCIYI